MLELRHRRQQQLVPRLTQAGWAPWTAPLASAPLLAFTGRPAGAFTSKLVLVCPGLVTDGLSRPFPRVQGTCFLGEVSMEQTSESSGVGHPSLARTHLAKEKVRPLTGSIREQVHALHDGGDPLGVNPFSRSLSRRIVDKVVGPVGWRVRGRE